ncbi:MAG: histidine phosphatase family protein [Deltaproteobacteria bacterium]|nr:histidine phosphatase family protein [Deltaproteobacteria bacterium]
MEIYLMQHGPALSKDQDPEEGLGPEGKDRIHASGQALKKMGVTFDVILSSPKKRSKQTAAIVAEEVGFPLEKIVETPKVKAMTPPEETEVASFLLTEGSKAAVQFEMGGCCRIDVDALPTHSGRLRWYLTPAQLKLIAS